jgi:hypothetical protein
METAINIGFACKLLAADTNVHCIELHGANSEKENVIQQLQEL